MNWLCGYYEDSLLDGKKVSSEDIDKIPGEADEVDTSCYEQAPRFIEDSLPGGNKPGEAPDMFLLGSVREGGTFLLNCLLESNMDPPTGGRQS